MIGPRFTEGAQIQFNFLDRIVLLLLLSLLLKMTNKQFKDLK